MNKLKEKWKALAGIFAMILLFFSVCSFSLKFLFLDPMLYS